MILFTCTIPTRAAIKKNGQRVVRTNGKRPCVIYSDLYKAWSKIAGNHIKMAMGLSSLIFPIKEPINLCARFYFKDHQAEADLSNLYHGVEDMLQSCGVIEDDAQILGHNGSTKMFGEEPRCEIEITKYE